MKSLKKLFIYLSLVLTIFCSLQSQTNIENAWNALGKRDRAKAREYLQKALNDPKDKFEATLSLFYLNEADDKEEESLEPLYELYKNNELPDEYLYAIWFKLFNDSYVTNKKISSKFMEKILDNPNTHGTIKANIYWELGKRKQNEDEFEDAIEEFTKYGAINNWQIVGTFDNISGGGFDKNYEPVNNPKPNAEFINEVGAKVKWYSPPGLRNDGWLDFGFYFNYNNSVQFAQTFVNSPNDAELYLNVGISGSMKVWLNDALVFSDDEEKNTDLDVYIAKVKLSKGYNRILVQIGENYIDKANFLVRFTDSKFNPVIGLTYSGTYQDYPKLPTQKFERIPVFAETFFENKIKSEPNKILNYLLLADVYLRNDKIQEARKLIENARKKFNSNISIDMKLLQIFIRDDKRTKLSEEIEKLKDIDPDNYLALNFSYKQAINEENYTKAEGILNKIESLYKITESTIKDRLELFSKQKKYEELYRLVKKAYDDFPYHYDFAYFNFNLYKEGYKNLNMALDLMKRYNKRIYSISAQELIAKTYMEKGDFDDGIDIYEDMIKRMPYKTGFYYQLAEFYYNAQKYKKALEWVEKGLKFAPYASRYWSLRGSIYQDMKEKSLAIESYQMALTYSPTNFEIRKKIRELENKKEISSYFKITEVNDIVKSTPTAEDYPDDNMLYLKDEQQKTVYEDGTSEEKSIFLVKILNTNGLDRWKEYNIPHNWYSQKLIVEKAEIIKPNKNKIQAEDKEGHLVFTSLEVGDIIHVEYRLENYNSGKLMNHFWDKYYLNFFAPSLSSKYSLLVAKNIKFDYKVTNSELKPQIDDLGEFKLYTWEMSKLPAVKSESHMPPLTDIGNVLYISSIPDWNFVANWYADIANTKSKADYDVKDLVKELFNDNEKSMTEFARAKVIYEYMNKNIRYSSIPFRQSSHIPQKTSKTINTKLGDCKDMATLFVSLCSEVGIKANLVLVDTRDNGNNDMTLPSIDFNHCIARAMLDGKEYYIELTYEKASFTTITKHLQGSIALNIPKPDIPVDTKMFKIDSKNRLTSGVDRITELSISGLDMNFKRRNIRYGESAARNRNTYADLGKDAQEKNLLKSIGEDFKSSVKLTNFGFKELNNFKDTMENYYDFSAKNEVIEMNGMKLVKLPWVDGVKTLSFLSMNERKFPLNFWEYEEVDQLNETINLTLPEGQTFADVPKPAKLDFGGISYSIDYKMEGKKLIASRKVKFNQDVFGVSEFEGLKSFYDKVSQLDSKYIGIK